MTGLDFSHRDDEVRLVDDLFRHFHGRWLATAQIDPDKSSAGAFVDLRDDAEANVRAIVEGIRNAEPGSEEAKIAQLYASFMNEQKVEKLGAAPLRPLLEAIEGITDGASLASYLGDAARRGLLSLVHFGEETDPGDPSRYVLFIAQSGLGLPDEEYYRLEEHAETRAAYRAHVERMLALGGVSDAADQADAVLALETKIAAQHWDKVRCRDIVAMFNPKSWEELQSVAPGFAWERFREGAGIPVEKLEYVVVEQPSFVEALARLVEEEPADAWRAWARWHVISSVAPYLSSQFVEANFDFYGRTLSGTQELRPRWKRGIAFVEGVIGEAIGKLYVAKHFKPEAKAAMDALVGNLIKAYDQSIRELTWMSETTKEQALEKLRGFTPKIGYPSRWRDYSALEVGDDLLANVLASNEFDFEYSLSRVLGPVQESDWAMLPQTVNAYYHPLRNEIVFPAAILQPPFFNIDADDAVNYGAIGAIIGHEIGHGFDDKGSTTDAEGKIRDWWTADDKAAFEQATARLVSQYNGLSPEGVDGHVNGKLTLGEIIGDLGGVGIAYKAWLIAGGRPDGEPIDGFTPAQRFFLSYAQVWQSKRRPEMAKMLLSVDPHSPAEFRVNQIVKNVDAFHEAFDTAPGDGLWLEPQERVSIW
ncbi:M13 family metallopeptidase [uncultured Tessaracoccus sp.]|uniref:M13 family metallopeptidase n=1 Tax=uncultured Tessaracoccus sp. TaxID=905023 RepID=UPI00260AE1D9|nr:M13-type metalloendopeptidase [uncultured Tessaracoccus sp.]